MSAGVFLIDKRRWPRLFLALVMGKEHPRELVKRILRKYGYPPDKQEKTTQTVWEQAEVLSEDWATS